MMRPTYRYSLFVLDADKWFLVEHCRNKRYAERLTEKMALKASDFKIMPFGKTPKPIAKNVATAKLSRKSSNPVSKRMSVLKAWDGNQVRLFNMVKRILETESPIGYIILKHDIQIANLLFQSFGITVEARRIIHWPAQKIRSNSASNA